jgi:hypothetical protein
MIPHSVTTQKNIISICKVSIIEGVELGLKLAACNNTAVDCATIEATAFKCY